MIVYFAMSIEITFDRGVRILRFESPLTNDSIVADLRTYWTSAEYDNSLNELYDARGLEISKLLDGRGLRSLGILNNDLHSDAPRVKVAVVIDSQVVYGIARQTIGHLGQRYQSDKLILSDNYDEAMEWLTT